MAWRTGFGRGLSSFSCLGRVRFSDSRNFDGRRYLDNLSRTLSTVAESKAGLETSESEKVLDALSTFRDSLRDGRLSIALQGFRNAQEHVNVEDAVKLSDALCAAGSNEDALEVYKGIATAGRGNELQERFLLPYALAHARAGEAEEAWALIKQNPKEGRELLSVLVELGENRALQCLANTRPEWFLEGFKEIGKPGREDELKERFSVEYAIALLRMGEVEEAWTLVSHVPEKRHELLAFLAEFGDTATLQTLGEACAKEVRSELYLAVAVTHAVHGRRDATVEEIVTWSKSKDSAAEEIRMYVQSFTLAGAKRGKLTKPGRSLRFAVSLFPQSERQEDSQRAGAVALAALVMLEGKALFREALKEPENATKDAVLDELNRILLKRPTDSTVQNAWRLSRGIFRMDLEDLHRHLEAIRCGKFFDEYRHKTAWYLVQEAKVSMLIMPTLQTFRELLRICRNHSRRFNTASTTARMVMREMELLEVIPDEECYALVLETLGRRGDWVRAVDTLTGYIGKMQSPAMLTRGFEGAIQANAIAAKKAECLLLLGRMKDYGLKPTRNSYNSLLVCLGKCRDRASLLRVLETMYSGGDPDMMPTSKTFTGLLSALCVARRRKLAVSIFHDCAERIAQLNSPVVYNFMIEASTMTKDVQWAEDVYKSMRDHKITPNGNTYVALAGFYCSRQEIPRASEYLANCLEQKMKIEGHGLMRIIECLAFGGLFKEAIAMAEFGRDSPFPVELFSLDLNDWRKLNLWVAFVRGCMKRLRFPEVASGPRARIQTEISYMSTRPEVALETLLAAEDGLKRLSSPARRPPTWLSLRVMQAAHHCGFPEICARVRTNYFLSTREFREKLNLTGPVPTTAMLRRQLRENKIPAQRPILRKQKTNSNL
ncbi:hypothetical protein NDN08_006771 [Rhodosorus marinus]|uniref:Pentacotripeptide-repeat region of PRORP domain-containing protein n=1 Tax=Rhodosorus marinus TaxID=101924 RepID=A0AAV8UK16_9RHOD|nr:hypothetical protein NDN08_006771 [Rhodosorus marinus]